MVASADAASANDAGGGLPARLGCRPGLVVREFGYDDDVDDDLRSAIADAIDSDLLDEDEDDVADMALLWWRDYDGDLGDRLVDVLINLADQGAVLLATPKTGRDGHVQASEVEEAAESSGLRPTKTISAGPDWLISRLEPRGVGRR